MRKEKRKGHPLPLRAGAGEGCVRRWPSFARTPRPSRGGVPASSHLVAPASAARRGRPTRPQSRKSQPRRGPPCKDCTPPPTLESLTARAAQLVAAGRVGAARPLLAAAKRLSPGSAGLADLSARLALRANDARAASARTGRGRRSRPEHPGLRKRRAELRRQAGDIEGAARDAAEAVVLDRTDPAAKALLGVLLLELGPRRRTPSRASPRQSRPIPAIPASPRAWPPRTNGGRTLTRRSPSCCAASRPRPAWSIRATPPSCCACAAAISARPSSWRKTPAAPASPTPVRSGLLGHALSSLGQHAEAADCLCRGAEAGSGRSLCAPSGCRGGCRAWSAARAGRVPARGVRRLRRTVRAASDFARLPHAAACFARCCCSTR